jgi:chemotaxis protein MotB
MSRKKKHEEHVNHERWLVSYADFITLLFAFFVVMYASSRVDGKKMGSVSDSLQVAFGPIGPIINWGSAPAGSGIGVISGNGPAPAQSRDSTSMEIGNHWDNIEAHLREVVEEIKRSIRQGGGPDQDITVYTNQQGLIISISDKVLFDPGQSAIREDVKPFLDKIARALLKVRDNIRVEGHTDNVPISTPQFPSNWELSTGRATSIIRYFLANYSFNPQNLSAAGYGEYHPLAPNDTEAGRIKNRRVDIVILDVKSGTDPQNLSEQPDSSEDSPDARAKKQSSTVLDLFFPADKHPSETAK